MDDQRLETIERWARNGRPYPGKRGQAQADVRLLVLEALPMVHDLRRGVDDLRRRMDAIADSSQEQP